MKEEDEGCFDLSRRSLLGLLGFSLAAAGCERSPVREAMPFVEAPEEMMPGEALYYATTCAACTAACPLLVKTRDGRPIKVEGNPDSELTGGGTCAVGQASVLGLYDETRLRGPLWKGKAESWKNVDAHILTALGTIAANGGRLALLTGTLLSPAGKRLVAEWLERFSGARHVTYDPVSAAAIRRAHTAGYGTPVLPHYRFDRARVTVGLEADFLGTWLSPVEFTRAYTRARRNGGRRSGGDGHGSPSWHAQFESRFSLTGSRADLRVGVNASEIGRVARALYDRVAHLTGEPASRESSGDPPGVSPATLDEVAAALVRERGSSLVVSGANDPAVQMMVAGLNALLGNVGHTVDLDRPSAQCQGEESGLVELVEDMRGGEIDGVILWGVNPAYETPLGEAFVNGLERVTLSVALSDHLDETAAHVDAVCPDHHPLESWNDAEPVLGTRNLAQPTLRPLFDTRAAQSSLLFWMSGEKDWNTFERRGKDWYEYLRDTWREETAWRGEKSPGDDAEFDRFWQRSVHDGGTASSNTASSNTASSNTASSDTANPGAASSDTADPPPQEARRFAGDLAQAATAIENAAQAASDARGRGGFDLVLYEKIGLRDGRQANNPWLQELPDPVSRVAWGNYAALAPSLARRLDLDDGDVVRLEVNGRSVELPVLRQPGQAPETVAVALGYGRRRAGKAADGVGADAYPLVGLEDGLFRYTATAATIEPAGRREPLAAAQRHHSQEGRPLVKETTLESWRENPAAGNEDRLEHPRLWPERPETGSGHRWGLAIDLDACVGCSACVVACQAENNIPVVGQDEMRRGRGMHWLRVDRYYNGPQEAPDMVFQPMMCQHCADAPCESVCPVLATVHSSDGLNQQIYNRCIGTRYCANNCPYKVRRFNWFNYAGNDQFDFHANDALGTLVLNPDVVVRSRGVMEKCSMCIQRIQAGKLRAKIETRALVDGEIQTACQEACPADAIHFGDLADPASRIAELARDPRFYHVLEELNTRPGVGYLTQIRHRPESPDQDHGHEENA